jgi:hypothetical protein
MWHVPVPIKIHFLLTLGLWAAMHLSMNYSNLARRISVRARRLSAGAWDMRMR